MKHSIIIFILFILTACGGSDNDSQTSTDLTLTAVKVTALSNTLEVSQQIQLSLRADYSDGSFKDQTSNAQWQVSDASLASIDSNGMLTALMSGAVEVTASFEGKTSAAFIVTIASDEVVLDTISLASSTPAPYQIYIDQTISLQAIGHFSDNSQVDLDSDVIWNSSVANVASIDAEGIVTALSTGSTSITATKDGVTSSAVTIQVIIPSAPTLAKIELSLDQNELTIGQSTTAQVIATYSDASTIDITTEVSIDSFNDHIVAVDQQANITANQVGKTIISANYLGLNTSAVITVPSALVNHSDVNINTVRYTDSSLGRTDVAVYNNFAYVLYADAAINDDNNGRLAKINLADNSIQYSNQRFLTIGNGDASHNGAAIAVDGDGYIHAWIGMHNHQMRYYRSTTPESIESFDNLSNQETFASYDPSYDDWSNLPTPEDNNATYYGFINQHPSTNLNLRLYSYPEAASLSNGDVVFIARRTSLRLKDGTIAGSQTGEKQDFYHYDFKTKKWTEYLLKSTPNKNAYMSKLFADKNNNVHIVTAWSQLHSGDNTFQRGTYVKFNNETKTFHKADETAVALPISVDGNNSDHFYPFRKPWGDTTVEIQTPQITLNAKGTPVISYPFNIDPSFHRDSPDYQLRIATWTGSQWFQTDVNTNVGNHERPPLSYTNNQIQIHTRATSTYSYLYSSNDNGLSFNRLHTYGHDKSPIKAINLDAQKDLLLNSRSIKLFTHN
ncbi:BNR-4 repeat-containing protein [Paraferrimonas sp. SM1919]|uniref:BNR-4 repeat-containing protein n=1 Tax=Paraferrimonas sp. SM1919 TaxID=2662263 RepID=UPI0013D3EF77|nr:BNR-4 repeat-containing protein [Paraferrimonas sp. SM1919]